MSASRPIGARLRRLAIVGVLAGLAVAAGLLLAPRRLNYGALSGEAAEAELGRGVFDLPLIGRDGVTFDIDPLRVANGSSLRIRFRTGIECNAVVIESAGGRFRRLFPSRSQSGAHISATEEVMIPRSGKELTATGSPGRRVARLVVFAPEDDPLSTGTDLRSALSVLEREYEIE